MQRVTMSLDDELAAAFDAWARRRAYRSRSEAMRDLLREAIARDGVEGADGGCVASLSYVYNHHERSMAARLTEMQHDHHDVVLATAHVHLDHDNCLETVMLRGARRQVEALADQVRAERGVKHAALNLIPTHTGGGDRAPHRH